MSVEYAQMHSPPPQVGIDGIPPALLRLCHLNDSSTAETNPYLGAVHGLAQVENIPLDQLIPSRLMTFTRHLQHSFKAMLQDKDPVALLLLALWYSKAGQFVWWIYQGAAVEGQSICLYLQRYHQETIEIQDLLPWKVNGEVGSTTT
jgi:hypothetical protein